MPADMCEEQRTTLRTVATEDLGYCCLAGFLCFNRSPSLVAAATGINRRAVRRQKARLMAGLERCGGCTSCVLRRIPLAD